MCIRDSPTDVLSRRISTLPVVWVRRNSSDNPTDFTDFRVNKNKVKLWLEFLIENNPLYSRNSIDNDLLNKLPENGSVLNELSVQDEQEITCTSASCTQNSTSNHSENNKDDPPDLCEQDLGPKQGGATGTNSLIGTDYLGPTTVNDTEMEEERIRNILHTQV